MRDDMETVDLDIDPAEDDDWNLVGYLAGEDTPVYYNPEKQQMAIMDDE